MATNESPTRFYAQFELDSVRGVKQLADILEHVTARLGSVRITVEVEADEPGGFDEAARRIVTENAHNLGAKAAEFD